MTTPGHDGSDTWQGLAVLDADHQPLGRIDDVYRDRATGQPEWMLVHPETTDAPAVFVPVHRASKEGDAVVVPYDRGLVERAPGVPPTSQLSEADEARLYDHYGISYSAEQSPSGLPAGTPSGGSGEVLSSDHPTAEPGRSTQSTAVKAAVPAAAGLAAVGAVGAVLLRRRRQRQHLTPLQRAVEEATRAARQLPRGPVTGRAVAVRRRIRRQAPGTLGRAVTGAVVTAARTGYKTGATSANTRNRAGGGARQAQRMASQGRKAARRAARDSARNARLTARAAARSTGATMKSTRATVRSAASRASDLAPSPRLRGPSSSRKPGGGLSRRSARMRRGLRAGALVGMAIGYVLGSRAGRERYEAVVAAARGVAEQPSVDRLKSELTGLARAQVDRANAAVGNAGDRAADRVGKARESASRRTTATGQQTDTTTAPTDAEPMS